MATAFEDPDPDMVTVRFQVLRALQVNVLKSKGTMKKRKKKVWRDPTDEVLREPG